MGKIRAVLDNKKGFTLIEVMIVVAIIGSLSAIAIANMISYRDKTYCPLAEQDAQNVRAAISEYFSLPNRSATPHRDDLKLSVYNGIGNVDINGDANQSIRIDIKDKTERCPRGDIFTMYIGVPGPEDGWHN